MTSADPQESSPESLSQYMKLAPAVSFSEHLQFWQALCIGKQSGVQHRHLPGFFRSILPERAACCRTANMVIDGHPYMWSAQITLCLYAQTVINHTCAKHGTGSMQLQDPESVFQSPPPQASTAAFGLGQGGTFKGKRKLTSLHESPTIFCSQARSLQDTCTP